MGKELTTYDAKYAELAEKYASREQASSGSFLSVRGGVLHVGEDQMPGNQVCVIVLDAVRENAYYDSDFNPESQVVLPPKCFAFGETDEDMAPHEVTHDSAYFEPQSEDCASCPMNEWGSGRGKGKACGNRRRLALLAAGVYQKRKGSRDFDLELFDDVRDFAEGDIAFLKLPVTSAKNWSKYVNSVAAAFRRPPFGVITRIFVEPDPKTQFKVCFETIEEVPDELFETIMARHEEAAKMIVHPYQEPDEEALEHAEVRGPKGIKGLRKAAPSRKRKPWADEEDED